MMKIYPIATMVRLLLHCQSLTAVMMQAVQTVDRIQTTIRMIPQQISQFQAQVQESQETVNCKFKISIE